MAWVPSSGVALPVLQTKLNGGSRPLVAALIAQGMNTIRSSSVSDAAIRRYEMFLRPSLAVVREQLQVAPGNHYFNGDRLKRGARVSWQAASETVLASAAPDTSVMRRTP